MLRRKINKLEFKPAAITIEYQDPIDSESPKLTDIFPVIDIKGPVGALDINGPEQVEGSYPMPNPAEQDFHGLCIRFNDGRILYIDYRDVKGSSYNNSTELYAAMLEGTGLDS